MFCGGFGGYGFGPFGASGSGLIFLTMGFRLLVFIGFMILAYKLFKSFTNRPDNNRSILDERFAKGEITEEEYLRRKTILSQKN